MSDLPHLAGYIEQLGTPDTLEQAVQERDFWVESAAQFNRNEEYYRGLLDECAVAIGIESYTADDGSIYDEPVRAKVPDLVRAILGSLAALVREYGRRGGSFDELLPPDKQSPEIAAAMRALASRIEARQGHDPQGHGAKHESLTAEGRDAQNTDGSNPNEC